MYPWSRAKGPEARIKKSYWYGDNEIFYRETHQLWCNHF